MNQWKGIESSEINPYIYGQSISDKGPKKFSGERMSFSTNGARIIGYQHAQKNNSNNNKLKSS